jgi:hypothetical protein
MYHKNIFENAKSIAISLLQRVLELNEKEESPIKVGFIVFGRKPDANRPAILSESKIGNQIFQTTLKEGAAIGELVDMINLRWISPSGCTPLYDAIYTACEESANDGRNWIVVISDGSNGLDLPRDEKIDKETGKISKKQFFEFYEEYSNREFIKKESQGDGGNFYATTRKRLSITFASHINNAVKSGKLLHRDAYKLTSLKGDTFQTFFNNHI